MCILPFQTPPDCSKSRSVAAAATAIAESGLVIGAFFLILGVTDVVDRIARVLPGSIVARLQLGLGLSLAGLGIRLIETQIWLGVAISGLMRYRRSPAALDIDEDSARVYSGGSPPTAGDAGRAAAELKRSAPAGIRG